MQYDISKSPPFPCIRVEVGPLRGSASSIPNDAKVDTGAAGTIIPTRLAKQLGLLPLGESVLVKAFDPSIPARYLPAYYVILAVGTTKMELKVLAIQRSEVLLGRDVLNKLKLLLDGPSETLDIL